jgi:hypothetical protein
MLSVEQFLALPWSDNVRQQLASRIAKGDVEAVSARRDNGRLVARVWPENPGVWDDEDLVLELVPAQSVLFEPAGTPVARTAQAIALMKENGWSAYKACKAVGVSQAAVSRALKRMLPPCPTCGQPAKKL